MNQKEEKKRKRGLITFLIFAVLVVLGVLAVYYRYMKKQQLQDTVHTPTTETEKLVAKDLDVGYPETPKEVIKLFGRINQCIYNKSYLTMIFRLLLKSSVCFTVQVFRKKIHRKRWKVIFQQRRKNILRKDVRLLITV